MEGWREGETEKREARERERRAERTRVMMSAVLFKNKPGVGIDGCQQKCNLRAPTARGEVGRSVVG